MTIPLPPAPDDLPPSLPCAPPPPEPVFAEPSVAIGVK